MNAIQNLARDSILKMVPYSSARCESAQQGIRLDANENPFVQKDGWNRYPDPQPILLKQTLAELYGVDESRLIMTRGSDEGIDLLMRVFCEPSCDSIIVTPPTYGMYEVAASIQGADVIKIPLTCQFAIDKKNIVERCRTGTKLIFLCSPNNPTGNELDIADILDICEVLQGRAIVVLDEAYVEFSTRESLVRHIYRYSNLVILRTLSKAFGLAGIRLGCVIASQEVISLLKKIIAPYPIPKPVEKVAMSVLARSNLLVMDSQIQLIRSEREKMCGFLTRLSSVENVYPSEANFVLVKVKDAKRWLSWCAENNIIIRARQQQGLENCVRITIGTCEENERLKEVLSDV